MHGLVSGSPRVVGVQATVPLPVMRPFAGQGPPGTVVNGVNNLPAGNQQFNGINSGIIIEASIVNGGAGYKVNDTFALVGGVGNVANGVVDAVDGNGAMTDAHIIKGSEYTTYPPSTCGSNALTGNGAGATFNPHYPAPDVYFDTSTPGDFYVCILVGSNATSQWKKISAGGGSTSWFQIISRLGNNQGGNVSGDVVWGSQVSGWQLDQTRGLIVPIFPNPKNFQPIAKLPHMRTSKSKDWVDGVIYNFTTPNGGDPDNNRTSTDPNNNPESENAEPRYYTENEISTNIYNNLTPPQGANCYILATQIQGGAGPIFTLLNPQVIVTWQEVGSRDWVALS